jgi:Holliday junction resolvasome RuvABC endonuclease subunit
MNYAKSDARDRVLAIHPVTSGFGWVIFSSPLSSIDWGVVTIKGKKEDRNGRCLERFGKLLDQFQPAVLVVEQFEGRPSRRSKRIQRLGRAFLRLAQTRGIEEYVYSRNEIASAFEPFGVKTRRQTAATIATHIDAFGHLLPPTRKIWQPENPRSSLFDAAALAIAYFAIVGGEAL